MLFVGTLAWVAWHLGGVMGESMARGFLAAMAVVPLVWLRWLAVKPTGLPRGWWWPLPMLVYAAWHARSLSATPGRATMEALFGVWGVAGFWVALHVVRIKEARRWVLIGVSLLTLVMAAAAFYQRVVDNLWLPMGRTQVEHYLTRSSGTFGNPNNLAAWMLLVIPPAWWLTWRQMRRRPGVALAAGVLAAGATAGLALTLSRGALLALVMALVGWAWFGLAGGRRMRLLVAGGVLAVCGTGLIVATVKVPNVRDRLETLIKFRGELTRPQMWRSAWGLWLESPWIGSGGGSFEGLVDKHRPIGFRDGPKWAHNDYLNTLSDYGVVGFVLSWGVAAGGLATVAAAHGRRRRAHSATGRTRDFDDGWKMAVGVGIGAFLLATAVDFHLHIPALAWFAALAVAEWSEGRRRGMPAPTGAGPGWGAGIAAVGTVTSVVVALGMFAWPRYGADELRFRGRELTDRLAEHGPAAPTVGDVEPILILFRDATRLAPEHETGWAELSMTLALQAHYTRDRSEEIGREAEQAARRALALSDQEAMNWVRLGVALDLQGRWGEAGLAFGRATKLAPTNARVWYYQAFHFSQKAPTHALARSALATCLRLDGRIRQAKALQAALERSR